MGSAPYFRLRQWGGLIFVTSVFAVIRERSPTFILGTCSSVTWWAKRLLLMYMHVHVNSCTAVYVAPCIMCKLVNQPHHIQRLVRQ